MSPSSYSVRVRSKHIFLGLLSAFVSLAAAASSYGQGGGVGSTRGLPSSSGGSNVIQGRVLFPIEPESRRIKVRLVSTDLLNQSTVTSDDGAFMFNRLPSGHYTLVVDATEDFDQASEPVNIDRETSVAGRNMNIAINLKVRGTAAALAAIPKPAREQYTKGMEAAGKGENKKAADFFVEAIKLYPEFPQALTELGLVYMKLNKWDNAADSYRSLVKQKKADAGAHLNLGISLYNLSLALWNEKKTDEANQRLTEAEQALRQAVMLKYPGPNPHYYLGLTLIRFKKYGEAQAEMESAIANGGDNLALAHKYLGGLYMNSKRNKEAADHLEKYLQLEPKATDADKINTTIKDLRSKQ